MGLLPLAGHETLRRQFADAIVGGRLPQVLLLTGAAGVGKQRLALWLAQRALCTAATGSEPCGTCASCRRVLELTHPDLHWFVPVARPKAGEPANQAAEVNEMIEAVMAERRTTGRWHSPDGMLSHGVTTARVIQQRASRTSVDGGFQVFIIGHAERLVPQESSPEAANALLKLLEEPPARTLFVLTAATPGLLLTTIRSRTVPVRLDRLSDAEVTAFLTQVGERVDAREVAAARGSIGRLLAGTNPAVANARKAAAAVRSAAESDVISRSAMALRQGVAQARGDFTLMLDALTENLAAAGRAHPSSATAAAIDQVQIARERAQGNVNPQLLLAVLLDELSGLDAP
jgi:DNA polymerase-3 subunit delta'